MRETEGDRGRTAADPTGRREPPRATASDVEAERDREAVLAVRRGDREACALLWLGGHTRILVAPADLRPVSSRLLDGGRPADLALVVALGLLLYLVGLLGLLDRSSTRSSGGG